MTAAKSVRCTRLRVPARAALGHCEGKRPWIGQFAVRPVANPIATRSNGEHGYFPQTMSVISLPEFDAGLAVKVSAHYDRLKAADDLGALQNFRMMPELDAAFADIADETVLAEYHRQQGEGEREEVPVKTAEFEILDKGDSVIGEDDPRSKFFARTLERTTWDSDEDTLLAVIDKLVLVHRLREVVSLLGFTRFEAISPDKDGELDLDVIRASLAETITWLPAVETRGEGIFLSFNADSVERWLARPGVQDRGRRLFEGWRTWAAERHRPEEGFPGLAYIMLHSLSHILMTSIALDCGYPASSLRERVYAGDGGYGILIYTGSSDSEGTLGGLVETGRRLGTHLRRAVDDGRLCSNDPVCAEHTPIPNLRVVRCKERPVTAAFSLPKRAASSATISSIGRLSFRQSVSGTPRSSIPPSRGSDEIRCVGHG